MVPEWKSSLPRKAGTDIDRNSRRFDFQLARIVAIAKNL
jgi:hypothetical protein